MFSLKKKSALIQNGVSVGSWVYSQPNFVMLWRVWFPSPTSLIDLFVLSLKQNYVHGVYGRSSYFSDQWQEETERNSKITQLMGGNILRAV